MTTIVKVFQPSGILDGIKANELRQEISKILQENAKVILIDFKDVTFMDSSGLGALVLSLKNARSAKANLILCSLNDQIKILFELTSMEKVFDIVSSREDFEQKFLNKEH